MASIQDLKSKIKYSDVFALLEELGAEPVDRGDHIEALTICHFGDSHKLFYYRDKNIFVCYTHDGTFDIITLLEKNKGYSIGEAVGFLTARFGMVMGFGNNSHSEAENLNPLTSQFEEKEVEYEQLRVWSESELNHFYSIPHISWLREGISELTLAKYQIGFNIEKNQITIPHRDEEGNLVGIRARNLDEIALERGFKYTPVRVGKKEYKYPTGLNLYGYYQNKETIKQTKKIVLFEAEKSVLKVDSFYGASNAVALNGTMLSDFQIKMIDKLGVNEIIIALDKEFDSPKSFEAINYARKIFSIFGKLKTRYIVSVVWDIHGLLDMKDSPVDKGKEVYEQLLNERIYI